MTNSIGRHGRMALIVDGFVRGMGETLLHGGGQDRFRNAVQVTGGCRRVSATATIPASRSAQARSRLAPRTAASGSRSTKMRAMHIGLQPHEEGIAE